MWCARSSNSSKHIWRQEYNHISDKSPEPSWRRRRRVATRSSRATRNGIRVLCCRIYILEYRIRRGLTSLSHVLRTCCIWSIFFVSIVIQKQNEKQKFGRDTCLSSSIWRAIYRHKPCSNYRGASITQNECVFYGASTLTNELCGGQANGVFNSTRLRVVSFPI